MPDTVGDQILKQLQSYSSEIQQAANEEAEKAAKNLCRTLKQTSPKKTGAYAKAWRVKKFDDSRSGVSLAKAYVVYNSKKAWLSPLLEYGHAKRGGNGRVAPVVHIAPARAQAEAEFTAAMENIIREMSQ